MGWTQDNAAAGFQVEPTGAASSNQNNQPGQPGGEQHAGSYVPALLRGTLGASFGPEGQKRKMLSPQKEVLKSEVEQLKIALHQTEIDASKAAKEIIAQQQ